MNAERDQRIAIRNISIRNYKGIDRLDMNFPPPRLANDPDIFVMGSRNGLGKTSILECCALLLIGPTIREDRRLTMPQSGSVVNTPDLLIRADERFAEVRGDILIGEEKSTFQIRIRRCGAIEVAGRSPIKRVPDCWKIDRNYGIESLLNYICGFASNPVIENTFLLFHSYRKIQEGNPEMGMMIQNRFPIRSYGDRMGRRIPLSEFKLQILRSLMGQAELFEPEDNDCESDTIETLNQLVRRYAGGTISKLRLAVDNTIEFRVNPDGGGASFAFDGLSSGQKEMISTLFLIYYHTRNCPIVVLIDEPELHLNAEWHRRFVKHLIDIAPQNQYIFATNSEDIMDSISKDRRALLYDINDLER